tara:strand:+ start:1188 stop:1535 length:348 start_codon:yes stop_codon:yes gene_type:complete
MDPMALANVIVDDTENGASGEVDGILELDPMCMLTMVSVSSQARKNGSQNLSLSWIEGRPSGYGFSEKATANAPFSAHRWTSAAAATGSQRGIRVNGMSRPAPSPAHHSSIIQSL